MFASGVAALAALALPAGPQAALLAAVAACYLAIIVLVERAWRNAGEKP
jgi:hypothetical protein